MRRLFRAVVVVLTVFMFFSTAVYAITIVVDGDRDAAWSGAGGQTPGTYTDTDEPLIADNYDIYHVQWTNDDTKMYYLVDTPTSGLALSLTTETMLVFCLDTDGNAATGATVPDCNNQQGVERTIYITGTNAPEVYDSVTRNLLGTGTLGYNPSGATDPVVEVGVTLVSLGFGPGDCPSNIQTVVAFIDNSPGGTTDFAPDVGTFKTNCGAPTAVTLESFGGTSVGRSTVSFLVSASVLLLVVAGGWLVRRRGA